MINLLQLVDYYIKEKYSFKYAQAKVAQDILLSKIANSNYNENITIKGGIVMFNLTNNIRRATIDIDLSFIKYSLNDEAIISFFEKLINTKDGILIKVKSIKKLKHIDYNGKRVLLLIKDAFGYEIQIKLDIGVHTNSDMLQENLAFNIETLGKKINLKVNSKEQIFCEKVLSLLRHGIRTTRIKDFYDIYYLIKYGKMNNELVSEYFNLLKFNEYTKDNNINYIYSKILVVLTDKRIIEQLKSSNDWLDLPFAELENTILNYLKELV